MDELWEVSLVHDEASRFVLARDIPLRHLEAFLLLANEYLPLAPGPWWKRSAVMITRMDWTREHRQKRWELSYYKLTKSGAKRKRFPLSQIEQDWQAFVKADQKAARAKRKHEISANRRDEHLA